MLSLKQFVIVALFAYVAYYWQTQVIRGPVHQSNKDLTGKTVIITGGNEGIGKAAAIEFAKYGAKVIIASRNVSKSEKAILEISKLSGNKNIRALSLDLGDFDSVKLFAQNILKTEKNIDYLINNAGVSRWPGVSKYGFNNVFTVNHLGPFLLTNLLLEKMKSTSRTRPVRIINVSSRMHMYPAKFDFKAIKLDTKEHDDYFPIYITYGLSKLANVYFTSELNERIKDYDITTFSVHPGLVETEIAMNKTTTSYFQRMTAKWIVLKLLGRSPFYGAQTILYCALDEQVTEFSGGYFADCANVKLHEKASDKKVGEKLWEVSLDAVKDYIK